ncbi:e3 ubiquitin-protein ligase listerin-like protein, partial [Chrysochromulina tobinii]
MEVVTAEAAPPTPGAQWNVDAWLDGAARVDTWAWSIHLSARYTSMARDYNMTHEALEFTTNVYGCTTRTNQQRASSTERRLGARDYDARAVDEQDEIMSLLSAVLGGGDGLDPDATLLVKKLGKRDTISKVKALGELREALEAHGADWSAALLPHWVIIFCRLADDGSWQVREQTCSALNLFAQQ